MPLQIIHGDITQVKADAIVNAANTSLQRGGGVCGSIFAAAGSNRLQEACDAIGGIRTGMAVITPGFDLTASYIIHTAGPIWQGGSQDEEHLLEASYRNTLELARKHRLKSIAFPLISAGIYGYPKDQALEVASRAIRHFLQNHEMLVYLVFFDRSAFVLPEIRLQPIRQYLSAQLIEHLNRPSEKTVIADQEFNDGAADLSSLPMLRECREEMPKRSLTDLVAQLDESFSQMLLRLIDQKGRSDVEVYKRANLDRRLFSKIRSDRSYRPAKNTALSLAIALELSLDETRDLLGWAGFALSRSNVCDVIIQYFIEQNNFNIFEINEALFAFDQPALV